jgi:hypothetical protein
MNTTTSRLAATVAGALVLVLGSSMMSSLAHDGSRRQGVDLTASAHPSEVTPEVTDRAFDIRTSWQRSVHADTSALSSAICDGCHGHSATLQVVYARWLRDLEVDNAAVAWSSCSSCGGTALSVQVVIVQGARKITANNRALATNAACEACETGALAYQLVVATPDGERLSRAAIRELRDWVDTQEQLLREGAAATPRVQARQSTSGADTLESLVNDDLGSRTKSIDVDRQ